MVLWSNISYHVRLGGWKFESHHPHGFTLSFFHFNGLLLSFLQTDHLTGGKLSVNERGNQWSGVKTEFESMALSDAI